ncbi:MMPL family transporter [Nocardia asiatica]|uniref:MMPL family transporter n=1 Tax=Nocardia asiatica TaxID=209252 RepID=UPI0024565523|nr:MMPL family transporter [Nocardia asiatica]
MFTRWGDLVYRLRFAVIGIVAAALLALGGYGLGLEQHLSSSGWDDPTSESAQAARIADSAFGRDHNSDVIVLYTPPEGKTIEDPQFRQKIVDSLNRLPKEHPNEIAGVNGAYWQTETGPGFPATFGSKDKKYTFASIAIVGDSDTEMVRNFRKVKDAFYIPGVDVQVTGLQAVAGTLNDTMAADQKRMEILAIPAVAVLLFFIFGGLIAAGLPLVVGGLTVIGANGIIMFLTRFTEVNSFVSGVVSMIGLGLAIDYGLFIVSRFREELAEGYDTRAAVRRSVITAGRTVVFSATMIIASLGGMLLFPQGFLKSVAYGTIATVSLAALTAITILPAMLGVLGPRVDMLGLKRFRKTKTAEEVENGFWGKITQWVMKHPLKIAVPICIILLLLIIPVKNLAFGGINERYLPPDNKTRVALENFYEVFPLKKTDPVQIVMVSDDSTAVGKVYKEAKAAPGQTGFDVPSRSPRQPNVYRTSATLEDSENADPTIEYLRSIDVPDNVQLYVGGQPTIQKDSIDALLERMPLMIALVMLVTTLLMFLTFGSLVLPIKAALMSALGLGSTLGILTWIFVDGHGAGLLNFTPQPIMSPVLVLIIAVIYGLSTDYEVFLLSRMVEARTMGASTTEAVRAGTAHTGRIITAAALILLVVVGAFAFSDLVMMQYIAYGLIAALFIDATILRMLLVPATMKLLGDDCWWAPAWMKKIQQKIGLGEPILDDERPGGGDVVDLVKTTPITDPVTMQIPAVAAANKVPRRKPRTVAEIEAEAPTRRLDRVPPAPAPPATPAPPPLDPTRQRPETPQDAALPQGEPIRPRRAPNAPRRVQDQAEYQPPSPPGSPQDLARPRPATSPGLPQDQDAAHPRVPSVILPDRNPRPVVSSITPPAPPSHASEGPSLFGVTQDPTVDLAQQPGTPRAPRPLPPEAPAAPAHRAPEPEAPAEPNNGPDTTNRSSIENWMAELRSSRRHIGRPEEGRHHGGDGRTVSVNELLRRRDRE